MAEMTSDGVEVDYLVVGAGAMGLAFVDVLLTETDATVALVDRYDRPGGHWTRAYPFVRLHQPSAFGEQLGLDRVDTEGPRRSPRTRIGTGGRRLFRPRHAAVRTHRTVPPSPRGRVRRRGRHLGPHRGRHDNAPSSTRPTTTVPSMRAPAFPVAPGLRWDGARRCPRSSPRPTGTWWSVAARRARRVPGCSAAESSPTPSDGSCRATPGLLDRLNIQPVEAFFDSTVGGYALQLEGLGRRRDRRRPLRPPRAHRPARLDPAVGRPCTPPRCRGPSSASCRSRCWSACSRACWSGRHEHHHLDDGAIPTTPNTVHIDCTADGLERRPQVQPVFTDGRITLQSVRTCQQVFSAALIAPRRPCPTSTTGTNCARSSPTRTPTSTGCEPLLSREHTQRGAVGTGARTGGVARGLAPQLHAYRRRRCAHRGADGGVDAGAAVDEHAIGTSTASCRPS